MTEQVPCALWMPAHVQSTVEVWTARTMSNAGSLCLHLDERSTGRWVCVLLAGHEGRHG